MGKFAYAVLTMFAIELSLYLFAGVNYANSSLFGLILNPEGLVTSAFYILIFGALIVFAASTIIPGNFIQINTTALYAGIGVELITFTLSVVHLWQFLNGELTGIFDSTVASEWISAVIVAPFLVFYILAISEWVGKG